MYLKMSLHSQLMYLFSVEVLVNMTAFSVAKPSVPQCSPDFEWVTLNESKDHGQK